MSRKLDKIGEDLEKARARYEEYGKRIQELEAQYAEQEKCEISDIVLLEPSSWNRNIYNLCNIWKR